MGQEQLDALMEAVAAQESRGSGDTRARNRRTGAYGRYQIMPSNWGPWSREVFGEEVEQTPENQEQVARHKMSQYVERFGPDGALVAWYGGPRRAREWVENPDNPWFDRRHGGGQEPSVREYVNSVMGRMSSGQEQPQARVNVDPFQVTNPMSTERFAPPPRPAAAAPTAQTPTFPDSMRGAVSQAVPSAQGQELPSEDDVLSFLSGGGEPAQEAPPTEDDVLSFLSGGGGGEQPEQLSRPRQLAREGVEAMGPTAGRLNAIGSAGGRMLFGVGTPLVAAEAMIGSRLRGEPLSWEEALEYSRERRDALGEKHPGANLVGMGLGLGSGIRGGAAAVTRAPGAVQRLITPTRAAEGASRGARAANAGANLLRVSGAGATGAGVTAAMEEGVDAAPGAAGVGAAMGPAAAGVLRGGGVAVGTARDLARGNGAMRLIANRMRAPVEVVEENLARWNRSFGRGSSPSGRDASLAEVLDNRSAEEMALIGQGGVGTRAGRVFREAEEAAAGTRQDEVSDAVRRGGPTTSVSAEEELLAPVQRDARELMRDAPTHNQPTERVGGRLQTTDDVVLRRRDDRMDKVMGDPKKPETGIQSHMVPLTDDMLEVVMHPDVQEALPAMLRRRILAAVEEGTNVGSINIPVRTWDDMRLALGDKAGRGVAREYSRLREKVREYVGVRVPEYGVALDEYARRSQVATGMATGRTALTEDAKVFSGKLRTTGGGAPDQPARPEEAAMNRLGARIGARTIFANALQENPERTLETLAQGGNMMQNLRRVLQPEEMRELEQLAWRYGYQLNRVAGARVGAQGVRAAESTGDFEAAVRGVQATPEGRFAAAAAGRGRVADAAFESPQHAAAVAEGLAGHRGLQQRIAHAMGGEEAGRLQEVGEAATLARRNLSSMAPAGTEASQRQQAMSQQVNTIIGALVITGGRASGAMQASVGTRLMQRFQMTQKSAERAAQLLTDPNEADKIIAYLRARGATADQIHDLYMRGATAAGILTGVGAEGGGGGR